MSLLNAMHTLKNLGIEIPEDVILNYEGKHFDELNMIHLLQKYGQSNLIKFRFSSTNSNVGTINEFMKTFISVVEPTKMLLLGWAEGRRTDLDQGKTRYTAICDNLLIDESDHKVVTKDTLGLAYYGRKLTRVKVYVVTKQRLNKRKYDEVERET